MPIYPPVGRPFRISQYFGEHSSWYAPYGLAGHHGVDIPGEVGEKLHAGVGGWLYTTQTYAAGIRVHIQAPSGTLVYSHCQATVGPSRVVRVGQIVALLGNTGAHTTGAHVHVTWVPAPTDFGNGYKGAVDPWPMILEGMMELEKAGDRATAVRWQLEEAQREREQAADLRAQAERLEQSAAMRLERLVSPESGLAYGVEAALGLPVPDGWEGGE
ncbi:MAG: peptidoglycan DD-metalloendopeptidase family protein [Chloroflexi bacterium]|nr:peptidoglycan DD-metalloendopeptidase family protein [Chloroflexota bacterium]